MTIHSGQEQLIWEGDTRNLTARASGGRVVLHYRLTTHYLYYETGGIPTTRQQQIPLLDIHDVDVHQTLIQKTQHVGNVLVHVPRPDGLMETATLEWIPEPHHVRDIINQAMHAMRVAVHGRQVGETRDLGVHRFDYQPGQTGPQVVPGVVSPPMPGALPAGVPQPALAHADGPTPAPQPITRDEVLKVLRELGELRDLGIVTPEEFEAKKKDLLDRL